MIDVSGVVFLENQLSNRACLSMLLSSVVSNGQR